MKAKDTNILLNPDGRVYHLAVAGEEIADNILLVGDPSRVELFGELLTTVEFRSRNREFNTITGQYHGKPVTILSTGIGTDNIDIVVNELHIAANYNPQLRQFTGNRSLNLIRTGTSGALQPDVAPGSVVVTEYAMGLDNLFFFYRDAANVRQRDMETALLQSIAWPPDLQPPYIVGCSYSLANQLNLNGMRGITLTAPGFYAPQGRTAGLPEAFPGLNGSMAAFTWQHLRVLNYEMEASALYALGRSMGHKTLTVCLILANRIRNEFLSDYHLPMQELAQQIMKNLP
ncbi:MAG TPA: nucleoside phosphorylase [Bacteroidales bacterium]|nr:nucleoside phosphorylase [Bacteroidales bacterium]HRZ48847.1 nucleoside phosphorylase [Bacteroidales bacterium]